MKGLLGNDLGEPIRVGGRRAHGDCHEAWVLMSLANTILLHRLGDVQRPSKSQFDDA